MSSILSYKKYSKATICRHTSKPLDDIVVDKRKVNKPTSTIEILNLISTLSNSK